MSENGETDVEAIFLTFNGRRLALLVENKIEHSVTVDQLERYTKYERHRDGELLFENAHLQVYNVEHFAESRLGFYFKDLNEYGLYGLFVGNDADIYESYYRTDSTFKKEGRLLYDDD